MAFLTTYGFLIVSMALAALLALSLYIPFMAGQLSLASPGFYALGGYIAAVLATRVLPSASGSSPVSALLLEMVLAALASGLLAVAVGVPALRLRGIYFALATIAFVEILFEKCLQDLFYLVFGFIQNSGKAFFPNLQSFVDL